MSGIQHVFVTINLWCRLCDDVYEHHSYINWQGPTNVIKLKIKTNVWEFSDLDVSDSLVHFKWDKRFEQPDCFQWDGRFRVCLRSMRQIFRTACSRSMWRTFQTLCSRLAKWTFQTVFSCTTKNLKIVSASLSLLWRTEVSHHELITQEPSTVLFELLFNALWEHGISHCYWLSVFH